ncbi:MAG TPA: alpha/beta fold hydrolase [Candidatus Binataceae bacterium]|nr:alpha/beta fold hydrolase [Candidatus Binataceae bacterium]
MNLAYVASIPAGDGPFPALIAFHGRGGNALDMLSLAPYVCSGHFLTICPQGQLEIPLGDGTGHAWFEFTPGLQLSAQDLDSAAEAGDRFLDAVARRYPIDLARLVLLGFSQGGVMAYNLAVRHPERFAAIAGLSTRFPPELAARAGDREALARLPVLVQHGRNDRVIEFDRAQQSIENLRTLGAQPLLQEYDCGHEVSGRALADLSAWLGEKVLAGR